MQIPCKLGLIFTVRQYPNTPPDNSACHIHHQQSKEQDQYPTKHHQRTQKPSQGAVGLTNGRNRRSKNNSFSRLPGPNGAHTTDPPPRDPRKGRTKLQCPADDSICCPKVFVKSHPIDVPGNWLVEGQWWVRKSSKVLSPPPGVRR